MGTGYLTIQCTTGDDSLPVPFAHITISLPTGSVVFETHTDLNGNTGRFPLEAPDVSLTLDSSYTGPAYSTCNVDASADGFVTEHISGVEIVDTQLAILKIEMRPLVDEVNPVTDNYIVIEPLALLMQEPRHQEEPPSAETGAEQLRIPDYITVHLGPPTDSAAPNVRVKFPDYIKNVTSSEIYSTWPYTSLVANIHAIVTFALNRVYTEWYRNRGFNFDITSLPAYDQSFRNGGPIFQNIGEIVDGIFNVYAHRYAFINPFFTSFCNGTTSTCNGLSQWGTVTLANQGRTPIEMLRYYYIPDMILTASDNITGITESYPGTAMRVGSSGEPVRRMQNFLNRIRVNFPLIPRISNPNGIFGQDTEEAVRTFQRTFSLEADGIIGRQTWNKISFIYVGVTRMAELDGEGERITIGMNPPSAILTVGSRGGDVLELQFILDTISPFYPAIPTVLKDSVFDLEVKNAVIEFQKTFGLTPDGIVGPATWNKLYAVYRGIKSAAPIPPSEPPPLTNAPPYPGQSLQMGSTGQDVRIMQTYLNTVRIVYPNIPYMAVDGFFSEATRNSVVAFQQEFLLEPDGIIGPITWNKIVEMYLIVTGNTST